MVAKLTRPIVVVEDSDEDFDALSRAFMRLEVNIPVQRFVDADECLEYLRQEGRYSKQEAIKPSLILLDLNLPGTDGKEALQQIKADDDLKCIPVTIVTSSLNHSDVDYCYRYGANGYMSKGGSFQSFQKSLGTMLDFWFETVVLP